MRNNIVLFCSTPYFVWFNSFSTGTEHSYKFGQGKRCDHKSKTKDTVWSAKMGHRVWQDGQKASRVCSCDGFEIIIMF